MKEYLLVAVMILAVLAAIALPFFFEEPAKDVEMQRWVQCFRTTSDCP